MKNGERYYFIGTKGSYQLALQEYLKAYRYNNINPVLNYKIGVCYLQSINPKQSLFYLKKVYDTLPNITWDLPLKLAMAYHSNEKFEKAIKLYETAKKFIPEEKRQTYIPFINKKIKECKNGLQLIKNPKIIKIDTIENINSEYPDYHPLITPDNKMLIFTSRRPNKTGTIDPVDGFYYEDVYMSTKENGNWSYPKNLNTLNTSYHDAAVGLSLDGKTLILSINGDLYYSEYYSGKWTKPKPFPKTINSEEAETSAALSPDGKTLYFTRGLTLNSFTSNADIYYSTKDSLGNWSEAKPISNVVNSPYDENGLFMFADGKTLYFSSKGHNSMGGYDIFMTRENDDGTWSKPVNLGYPINTPNDDIFFAMAGNGFTAYYSSYIDSSEIPNRGNLDIYKITIYDNFIVQTTEDNLIAAIAQPTKETILATPVAIIKGKILDQNGLPIKAEIIIKDINTGKIVYKTYSDPKTGEYLISLPTGKNYAMTISKQGYLFHSENINLINENKYTEVNKNMTLKNININSTFTLKNIFFDFGSDKIRKTSYAELNEVVKYLKQNPNIKIEIGGHTDNIGSEKFNKQLSLNRARAVAAYLINNGISADRIKTKGYGFSKPIAPNDTEEGRAKNRRVELKIIQK